MTNLSAFQSIVKETFGILHNDLQGENLELKSFPISIFPPKIRTMIKDICEVAGFNDELLSSSILTAISAAIGNTRKVELKTTHKDIASLFLIMVANPSSNKTRVLKFALQPLTDLQGELETAHKREIAVHNKEKAAYKKNPNGDLPQEPAPIEEVVLNDINIEAMFKLYDKNTRGMLYYVDEISNLLTYFDKDLSAETNFLELWNGGKRNRFRSLYKVSMPDVFLTLTGTTQPVNIARFGERNRNTTGFTSRFLFCFPPDIEAKAWSRQDYEGDEKDFYSAVIRNIFNAKKTDEKGTIIPHFYKFEEPAKELVFYWIEQHTKLKNASSNDSLKAYYGKLDAYLLRFCLVLQTFTDFCEMNPNNQLIRLETVMNAIHLIEYFRRNFFKVQREIADDSPETFKKMSEEKKEIYSKLNDHFSLAEANELGKFKHRAGSNFLNTLVKGGIIKKIAHGTYSKVYQI